MIAALAVLTACKPAPEPVPDLPAAEGAGKPLNIQPPTTDPVTTSAI